MGCGGITDTTPLFAAMQIMLPSAIKERETAMTCFFVSLIQIAANASNRAIERLECHVQRRKVDISLSSVEVVWQVPIS